MFNPLNLTYGGIVFIILAIVAVFLEARFNISYDIFGGHHGYETIGLFMYVILPLAGIGILLLVVAGIWKLFF